MKYRVHKKWLYDPSTGLLLLNSNMITQKVQSLKLIILSEGTSSHHKCLTLWQLTYNRTSLRYSHIISNKSSKFHLWWADMGTQWGILYIISNSWNIQHTFKTNSPMCKLYKVMLMPIIRIEGTVQVTTFILLHEWSQTGNVMWLFRINFKFD